MDNSIRQMVEQIVRDVLAQWPREPRQPEPPAPKAKVLYIFCDSAAQDGFEDQFRLLERHGVCCDRLFLDGETSAWLGMHRIECAGRGKAICADEYAPAPIELPKEYDGIVIPELDLDNAARIAMGMKGSVKAEIVHSALLLNKWVLVGEDGPSPGIRRSDRRTLHASALPLPYSRLFAGYVRQMKELGIAFARQSALADAALRKLAAGTDHAASPALRPLSAAPSTTRSAAASAGPSGVKPAASSSSPSAAAHEIHEGETCHFTGKLVSERVVKSLSERSVKTLIVRPGCLISPLAKDLLKEKGMRIRFSNEG